ncbi:DedA family protein [Patulibacter defluvii]|uniref:DedA family protein n=1 Tax=Patulibacter defluvii TaxID=3095358 RepID=UPI002A755B25|nr:DedA family protein [Patulibacter sp. DM4]
MSFSEILRDLGYAGLALLMLAETVFPPIPSEAVLPLAGYLVERGELVWPLVLLASTAGSVVGALVLYEAARRGGRPFAERFLRIGRIDPAKLDDAERWFARRGPLVVLVARCIPGVRSVVSLPAGLLRMPRWEYLLFTVLGSLAWNALLIGAGYLLGAQWEQVGDAVGPVAKPALALVVVAGGGWLLWRGLRARRRANATG